MSKLVVLTGAGISAESGIRTFRDEDGLWAGHRIEDVATPEAWQRSPERVLEFYNQRRRQLEDVAPNAAHLALAEAEKDFDVTIITQNVDDLHERAGSRHIIHLHGELRKARSTGDESAVCEWHKDLLPGDTCARGFQLRPHIVWFGEDVPALPEAIPFIHEANAILVVGSSMQVYPAAGLIAYARPGIPVFYVDPDPKLNHELNLLGNLSIIRARATEGVPEALFRLRNL